MNMNRALLVIGLSLCAACGGDTADGNDVIQIMPEDLGLIPMDAALPDGMFSPDAAPRHDAGSEAIEATIRVINPATGQGFSGVTVTSIARSATTDASGRAVVPISSGPYQVRLEVNGARTHTVWGVASDTAFEQITYMSPEMITGFVYSSLGLRDDPSMGILVIGLDTPTLAAAIGARASIDAQHGTPFVFSGNRPVQGQEIPESGQGFVTFSNVNPGPVNIEVSYPSGRCLIFPAETNDTTVEVVAGEVTVVAFTCRDDV